MQLNVCLDGHGGPIVINGSSDHTFPCNNLTPGPYIACVCCLICAAFFSAM